MDHLLALRAFLRVAEAGSFAKAADQLNLPRSSVSKLVQDLEAHLGAKLVERTTRSARVTVEGETYRAGAARLLADIDALDTTVGRAAGQPRGRLRVDIGSVIANQILIPRLGEFQARYPGIDLELGVNDRVSDLIGEGIDCVIRGGPLPDSALKARKLCELDFLLCAAPGYLAGKTLPEGPDDLQGHRIVSYFSASSGKRRALSFSKDVEYLGAACGISVSESTAHLNCLLAGLGIGQSFGFLVRPHLDSGALVELLPAWRPANRVQYLAYPAERFPNARLTVFADLVAAIFRPFDARR